MAVLDSRLATARYAGFLRASLPPYWATTDRAVVLAALGRLDEAAGPDVWPVEEPGSRAAGMTAEAAPGPVAESSRTAVTLGHAWTQEQDEELRDGVEVGCNLEELAEQLDLEPALVAARLEGLGLTLTVD